MTTNYNANIIYSMQYGNVLIYINVLWSFTTCIVRFKQY